MEAAAVKMHEAKVAVPAAMLTSMLSSADMLRRQCGSHILRTEEALLTDWCRAQLEAARKRG